MEERWTGMEYEELMESLMPFGRWMPQDSVVRSRRIDDVITYLRAECEFEILKLSSFVTTNLTSFERIKSSPLASQLSPGNDGAEGPYRGLLK